MKNLKKLREKKGEKQSDLANIIGMSRQAYQRYEDGSREPDFETLKKLADHFNVSVDYLIGNTEIPFKPLQWTEEEKALGVGNHAVKLSEDEWETIELFSELKRTCGDSAVSAVKTMISTLIEQKKKD